MCSDKVTEFRERLISLRTQKDVSANKMSLSIGQSKGYINKIENQKTMPSLKVFFHICEYLELTPMEFFDYDDKYPQLSKELINVIRRLNCNHIQIILFFLPFFHTQNN